MTPTLRRHAALLALAAASLALPAAAETATPTPAPEPRVIVTGEGRADVAPDMATMTLGVSTFAPSAAQALSDNSARLTAVIEVVKTGGVEPRDIQTSGLMLSPQFDYSKEGSPPQVTGYMAQNMLTLRLRDLGKMGGVLDAVVGAGATDFSGLSYGLQDPKAAEDAARRDAVAQAKARAELYAGELGLALGPVRLLSEQTIASGPMPMMMRADAAYGKGGEVPLQGGEVSVTATVNVEYALVAKQ